MVKNAVNEMRRYYSRKVVDVLIKVTRRALDLIIKQFSQDHGPSGNSVLIPIITISRTTVLDLYHF